MQMRSLVEESGRHSPGARLATAAPFHLEATVRVLQRRPTNPVDIWDEERYLRAFMTADGLVVTAVENRGSIDAPDVRMSVRVGNPSATTRRTLARVLRRILGLDVDPAPLHSAALRVANLRATALALRGMRPPRYAQLFDAFANVVPFQQLSLETGSAIARRLAERFGEHVVDDGKRFAAMPTARAIADARLPALLKCGLSRSKAECLRDLARIVESGELSEGAFSKLPTADALARLVGLPGIGPWSAALVLLRGLGRLDVFPPGDAGATRNLRALLRTSALGSIDRVVERFGDYRGYLYFSALGSSLLAKGLIGAAPPERVA
jgi:DNA-3-methyladenine glycosylase II